MNSDSESKPHFVGQTPKRQSFGSDITTTSDIPSSDHKMTVVEVTNDNTIRGDNESDKSPVEDVDLDIPRSRGMPNYPVHDNAPFRDRERGKVEERRNNQNDQDQGNRS
ncbi:hypothetical protein RSOLAG1IB_01156 [Rhizoctonia solani AG-1 IB]|uniref:Uncharacterized protein n=1 Tax=Thanatephorus cucumeris (strain AG1-IB / isolate 7/3/14) TaxID=1108050 RepID=A0A0B7FG27_THACB|nr:hypothetical protein RSOLAG1IB_01156 [Rhizoctonia solani AG-1 IB]